MPLWFSCLYFIPHPSNLTFTPHSFLIVPRTQLYSMHIHACTHALSNHPLHMQRTAFQKPWILGWRNIPFLQPLTVHHPPDPASAKPYRNQLHKLHCSERCCERVSSAHFDCYQSVKYLPSTPCPNKLPQDALIYHLPALKLFGTLVFECQILETDIVHLCIDFHFVYH